MATRKIHIKRNPRRRKALPLVIAVRLILILCVAVSAWQAYRFYNVNLTSYDGEEHTVYIYPETTLSQLTDTLKAHYLIASPFSLRVQAYALHWPAKGQQYIRTGRYVLPARMGNAFLIRKFRNGQQDPINLSFARIRTQGQLAARLSAQLMLDSTAVASRLADPTYMERFGLDVPNAVTLFLPNTYEMYWNIDPDDLFLRMHREYKAFWNEERLAKASALGFTPQQIATIASIVEEETNKDVDKPIIAGLYMNRLRLGMPLQACPTVKFALQDFSLRRILNRHLEVDSPYNTYKNPGLPPGPIRIPTAKTMDYVLNPVKSNYLFMCASTAFDGTHHFSTNYGQHAAYAREYQRALNARGIK